MGATEPAPAPLADGDLGAVLDAVPQGVLIVNERHEAVFANRVARDVLGDALELGTTVPWPVSGPDAGIVPNVLGGTLRTTSFALPSVDGLALIALSACPPARRSYAETGPEEQLHEVEAIAQLGSWTWEVGDDAVHWSDGLYRLYGLAPQSVPVTFAAFVEITPPEIRQEVVSTIRRCAETGDGYTFTTRSAHGAGGVRWRYSRGNTVTRDGRVERMFGTTQDVTERMLTEEVLRDSLEEADRLARENEALRAEVESQLAQVQASRARIVEAADTARRRLERDLRDGAQRRLTTVGSILRSAREQVDPAAEPDLAQTLELAIEELDEGVDELRSLARGLHPAVLTDEGLVAALGALASRSPVAVRLRADSIVALPSGVESAAYFVVAEALTNVVKHARASQAQVTVQRLGGALLVEVSDDGSGGATLDAGSGLRGLSDRVAALGGRLELYSPVPGGTLLRVELPLGGDSPAA
ncbi:MAG TPA: PAS domain-containing protein [Solirubrobacteraceae bacterium]|nr:PAS domain-containing protein [Solirubrobacteraceae bacterium]